MTLCTHACMCECTPEKESSHSVNLDMQLPSSQYHNGEKKINFPFTSDSGGHDEQGPSGPASTSGPA